MSLDDLNEAPIMYEPGSGNGDQPGGGHPTVYPTGGNPTGGGIFDPHNGGDPLDFIDGLPTGGTRGQLGGNVGAPTSQQSAAAAAGTDPLSQLLALLSAPGPLGIPVWIYLAGGVAAAYYFWPSGKARK